VENASQKGQYDMQLCFITVFTIIKPCRNKSLRILLHLQKGFERGFGSTNNKWT